jgi:hypothetical protein
MRGDNASKGSLFSYIDLEKRVRTDHPLRVTGDRELGTEVADAISTRCIRRSAGS